MWRKSVQRFAIAVCLMLNACSDVQQCEFDLDQELRARISSNLDLHDLTDFPWDEFRIYGEYTSAELVREQTGLRYQPTWDPFAIHVPPGRSFVAFMKDGSGVCGAHYDISRACLVPLEGYTRPVFRIAEACERPE